MQEVTIVIPVYNREKYLPRLFCSLSAITYPRLQVIFVDNGSEDKSLFLCQAFSSQVSFPVQVLVEHTKGASHARNAGLNACCTPWVYFFDSDDELSEDFLDILMPLYGDFDVLYLTTNQVDGKGSMVRPYRQTTDAGYQILSSMLNSPSMLFRTQWLRQIGGWDASLTVWDDWELGVRVMLHQPKAAWYTAKAFHKLYVHAESITGPSMSHNLTGKISCLQSVYAQLEEYRHKRALFLRSKIIEGHLRAEGTASRITGFEHGMDNFTLFLGSLLSLYTKWGGRGAWRIAVRLVSSNFI